MWNAWLEVLMPSYRGGRFKRFFIKFSWKKFYKNFYIKKNIFSPSFIPPESFSYASLFLYVEYSLQGVANINWNYKPRNDNGKDNQNYFLKIQAEHILSLFCLVFQLFFSQTIFWAFKNFSYSSSFNVIVIFTIIKIQFFSFYFDDISIFVFHLFFHDFFEDSFFYEFWL